MRKTSTILAAIPLLWMLAIALTELSGHPWTDEKRKLQDLSVWIGHFQKTFRRAPDSLAELRAFSREKKAFFSPFDSHGQRIEYLALNEAAYLLTAFGTDEQANTYNSEVDSRWLQGIDIAPKAIESIFPSESRMFFYQAAFLEGLSAPSSHLVATLFVNPRTTSRRILIQDPKNSEFAMVSAHDAVEEYLWLPSGHELIFTAFGSSRYEDGIYYWNLKTNDTHNFLSTLREAFFSQLAEDEKLVFSLSHVGGKPQFAYFFAAALEDSSMDPKAFYRYGNFFAYNLKMLPTDRNAIERVPSDKDFSIFEYQVNHRYLVAAETEHDGDTLQKAWLELPLTGNPNNLINKWQSFCSVHSDTPVLPYGLWWLASLYNDTFRYLSRYHPEQAQTVRNFGIEIAEALAQLPTAPFYKRAMAEYLKKNLLLSKVADYNVASMEAGLEAEKE